ncbi:transcriptional regulator [Enemella evansiae]|nr:transcriptional regulator [Enemella evansiae]TDO91969.1 putative NBD/HSP70 family sugar kinase [Enemella evansiae]
MTPAPQAPGSRGTNIPRIGDWNQRVVIDWVRRNPQGTSRVELAASTGLTPQTISNLTRRLLERGLIEERGQVGTGPGKPRTLLGLAPGGMHAIGVHLDPLLITLVVTDLLGRVVARAQRRTPTGSPGRVVRSITEAVHRLITEAEIDPGTVTGVGVAAPGPVEVETGTLVEPPLLDGWRRVPLRDRLAAALALPVLLEKDVLAAAVAEDWVRTDGDPRTFVFWYLGTGMGAGLVHRGEVLRGASNNVGEVGHLMVDPHGAACDCGEPGVLSQALGPRQLVAAGLAAGVLTPPLPESRRAVDDAVTELCRRSAEGDPAAAAVLDHAGELLARAVIQVCDLLDADEVVFGGPYWDRLQHRLEPVVRKDLHARAAMRQVHPIRVHSTRLGEDVAAIGAASLVLEDALSLRPTSLLLID